MAAQLAFGSVLERLGLRDQAIAAYREAAGSLETTLEEIHTDDFIAGLLGETTSPYPALVRLLGSSGHAEEAFDFAERDRGRALLHQLGGRHVDLRRDAAGALPTEEQDLRRQLNLWRRLVQDEQRKPADRQDRNLLFQLGEKIDDGRRRYETVLLRLKQTNPEVASLLRAAPLSAAEVRSLLDPETTLVEYFVLDDDTVVAWILERGSLEMVRLPLPSRQLASLVRELRDRIAAREPDDGLSSTLHADLLAPVLPHIHHRNLWLVPHGTLHLLPFAALAGADGQPLAATHTLAYLPSASVLPFVTAKRKPAGMRMLVLGDPDGSLPYAAAEARAVAGLYGVEPLLGARATPTALRERAPATDLLHIAAHAVFEPSRPLFSRIALAPDGAHDGALEAHEVFGLDLRRASLVVLSGCGSGLMQVNAGDDLVGLPRAFLYAGASSVIASLWSIDDEASAALMQAFYRHLKQGEAPAQALRKAQLAIRQDTRWQAPFYWAAFRLIGDVRGGS